MREAQILFEASQLGLTWGGEKQYVNNIGIDWKGKNLLETKYKSAREQMERQ